MERNEVYEKLKAILFDALEEEVEVNEESNLFTDLKVNSIALLYMALGIEKEFGIQLQNEEIGGIATVGQWVDFIQKKVG